MLLRIHLCILVFGIFYIKDSTSFFSTSLFPMIVMLISTLRTFYIKGLPVPPSTLINSVSWHVFLKVMQQILETELSSTVPGGPGGGGGRGEQRIVLAYSRTRLATWPGLPLVYLCDSMITSEKKICSTKCEYIHTTPLKINDPNVARRYNIMKQ